MFVPCNMLVLFAPGAMGLSEIYSQMIIIKIQLVIVNACNLFYSW